MLTAISWTYIIIAESLGNQGGIGTLIWRAGQRQGRYDKVFALLIIVILIGFLQDRLFVYLDKEFFPHKYVKDKHGAKADSGSTTNVLMSFIWNTLSWAAIGGYFILFLNEFLHFLDNSVLTDSFGGTVWVIHLIVFTIFAYKLRKLIIVRKNKQIEKQLASTNSK